MKRTLITLGVVALATGSAHASVLMSDNFDSYANGNLVGQGSWAANGGTLDNPVQVTNGTISLTQASGTRQDVNKNVGQAMVAGDKWYAGFTVTVSGPVSAADYFAAFYRLLGGQNYFPSKVGVTTSAGSDFTFYLHQGAGSTQSPYTVYWPTGFSFGQPYRLVASYEVSTGVGELWVDPSLALGPDGSAKIQTQNQAGSSLIWADMYTFRQGANAAGTQVIDDVIVATTWAEVVPEPASLALLVLGAFPLMRRRR
jgi:hypothetical protein